MLELNENEPSIMNGFRKLDWHRMSQMAAFFAKHCKQLGRTKLNKAMFYADYSCFAATSCSMSGLIYARATHGPVINQYDAIFGEMVRDNVLVENLVVSGPYESTVYSSDIELGKEVFTPEEQRILENVALFINGFDTASELSDYSHKENLWINTENGNLVSYSNAFDLNELDRFISS